MIKSLCTKICVVCGEEFESYSHSAMYCPKEECQKMKKKETYLLSHPTPEEDMPVGVVATILQEENTTYINYAKNRKFFIERYIKRNGIPPKRNDN